MVDEEYEAKVAKLEEEGKNVEDEESLEKIVLQECDVTQNYLTCDQSFIFSDEITIFHEKITEAILCIIDTKVYVLFKSNKTSVYRPFDL